jgi:glyoxylase-like metal-dependent hydrolase (beta-lactamase superfamily II)
MQVFENLHAFIWDSMTQNNCNTYLIDGSTRILIDPGHLALFDHVRQGLSKLQLDLKDLGFVLCTHAHPDHIEAIQLFKDTPALAALHDLDWQLVKDMLNQFDATAQIRLESVQPDFFVREGDLSINGLEFKVFHTPGHSPGSVSLYWPQQKALFTGDLVFKEGVGRTDLPGGNGTQLKESIRRLSNLDVEWLLSGHGDIVSGKAEVRRNFDQIEQFWFAYV